MTGHWRSREQLVHQVVTLARDGVSQRAIARAVGVSRNTVKAVLAAHAHGREAEHVALPPILTRAPRASKLDAFKPRVAELMARFADITAQRVFELLRSEGFGGGYTAVKKHMRRVRPAPKPTPSLTTPDYGPGEMAESDWSPYTIRFDNGQRVRVEALSYVLVSSKRKFFALYASNGLHALMDGHARAFERFGGCATRCKYDSQKPVVLRWEGNQPIYNPRFLAFSSHYEFRPLAVRRGHPNDKPRTERSSGRSSGRSSTVARSATSTTCAPSSRTGSTRRSIIAVATRAPRSSASRRSATNSSRCRGIPTTPRASSTASAASTASSSGKGIATPFPTTTSPISCPCA